MSAFLAAPFATVAPLLADYDYQPVPIKPGEKFPGIHGWQNGCPPGHYLPYRDPENGRITNCAHWGTGILTATCPAVDLDIRDREVVRALIELAAEMLGPSPFRVGAPPKVILPFSTTVPFDKITGRWWGLPGDDWRHPDYVPHRVEVLADGQQFFAYGQHPRGTFYRWRRFEPIATPRDGLPEIDQAEAQAFLEAAETVLQQVGAVPLKRIGGVWFPDTGEPEPAKAKSRGAATFATDSSWQSLNPETLAKRIDSKNARTIKDGWITACPAHKSEGARSLSITRRDGGGSVVHCFGECAFADVSAAISAIVGKAA